MSTENFAADPEALARSGKRFAALNARVDRIKRDVDEIATGHPNAAGDGDYRKSFDQNYIPLVVEAQKYMDVLSDAIEGFGDDTVAAAAAFDNADSNASSNASSNAHRH